MKHLRTIHYSSRYRLRVTFTAATRQPGTNNGQAGSSANTQIEHASAKSSATRPSFGFCPRREYSLPFREAWH